MLNLQSKYTNRSIWMGAVAVGILAAAGSAQATTYWFVNDYCSNSGCGASTSTPVGEVVTSLGSGGLVDVTVTLFNGATFHDTNDSQHHALAFDLVGAPTITVSNLVQSPPFVMEGAQSAHTVDGDGAGMFEYEINFPHSDSPPVETSFSFSISGATLDDFTPNPVKMGKGGNYFASDIWAGPGQTGNTGNVGAVKCDSCVIPSNVPEPATWALMLVGVSGLGASMRSRRRVLAQAT